MKVCFIGLGSIANRHIKNLKEIDNSIIIHTLRSNKGTANDSTCNLIEKTCYDEKDLDANYDAIFITNPTNMHYESLKKYINYSNNFFIEKPVFLDGVEEIDYFIKLRNKVYYTACPLRYSNIIQYLKKNIDFSRVYSMRCISSSYLPEWRKGRDYRTTYSANKKLGGGVEIDLIHEWDYISYLIGIPNSIKSIICKKSNLEIDSNDVAVYIAEYDDKVVELHLDYFGRKTIRKVELFLDTDTVIADFIEGKINYLCENKIVDLSEERDNYQKRELEHFLNIINTKMSDNNLEESCKILRLTRGCL